MHLKCTKVSVCPLYYHLSNVLMWYIKYKIDMLRIVDDQYVAYINDEV